MRLKRLDLKAFGPFTDRSLAFDSREPGLHIIFGPNEAGKSSSLRALKALLYGFHPQTPDNFLHSYDQLLVGGCLENSAGDEIVFQRRKKRINDLLDEDGSTLDPAKLAPFLHGVEPEIFESLYGIDHDRLVQGGHEILAQKGEVGQALFAAGAGIFALKEVIDQLENEASELFKPTGQLPEINQAVKRFKELQKEARTASLSAKDWQDHQRALEDAVAKRSALEMDRDHKNRELRRLERLHQAIPELAFLKTRQNQLQALGEVTFLPPDFNERHLQISQEIRQARAQLQKDADRLKQIEEQLGAITLNNDLLRQADLVDDYHQRLGEYRKGQKDKPVRDGMRISLRKEAALLLQQVRPDLTLEAIETLRPVLARKKTILTLGARFEAITQQLNQARKQKTTAEQEFREVEEALAALPTTGNSQGLLQAVKLAQKAGDIDALSEKYSNEVKLDRNNCVTELKRIGRWHGELAELLELQLPLVETVQHFAQKFSEISDERRSLEMVRKNSEKELKSIRTEIKKVEYAGEIPSEEELLQTRNKRELGWQLLRRQWLVGEDVVAESHRYDPVKSLPEAYEGLVGQADLLADRLRREAGLVAHAAALRAQAENLEESLAEIAALIKDIDLQENKLTETWVGVWKPVEVDPLSPQEMKDWLVEMEKLRHRAGDLLKKEQEGKGVEKRQRNLRQHLQQELTAMGKAEMVAGETLGPVLIYAEAVLEGITNQRLVLEKLHERRKKAQNDFNRAGADLNAAQEDLDQWRDQWRKALSGLRINEDLSPLEATDAIEALENSFDRLKEADDLKKRIDGIDRDAAALKKEVMALLALMDPDMMHLPLDQAILQLRAMLGQAQKDRTLHDKLSGEFVTLQAEVSAAEKTLHHAEEQMAELLRIAQCEKPEELAAIIDKFTDHQSLREKIADTEATLAKIGAGGPIAELIRQASEINTDDVPGRIESLQRDIEEKINPEINRISQVIGEEKTRLAGMDGSEKAADAAEKMEQELARIRRLAERYTRVKLASRILQQEIERYREAHQEPVLKLASRYFEGLTLNSFAGLRTDVDDRGEPVLIGIRPGGTRVGVDGMSDGTRDQLYLALRLATLESRLEHSEPMPFIVDDILINFDDERSKATLAVLADLGEKNQVILFTHHRQILGEATKLKGKKSVHIHEL